MNTLLKQFNITPERATEIGAKLASMPDFIEVHPDRVLNHLVTALGLPPKMKLRSCALWLIIHSL
jgi:hypothetical protein